MLPVPHQYARFNQNPKHHQREDALLFYEPLRKKNTVEVCCIVIYNTSSSQRHEKVASESSHTVFLHTLVKGCPLSSFVHTPLEQSLGVSEQIM